MSSNPFDFFEKIYCVNLPRSSDRWKAVSKVFQQVGIAERVERIWANPPSQDFKMSTFEYPPGEFGVCLSQAKALVHAIHAGVDNFLLLEDDIDFVPGGIERLSQAILELPSDWDMFYLGGNPREKLTKVSPNLSKTGFFYGGFAYAIRRKAMLEIYDQHLNFVTQKFPNSAYDFSLATYAKHHNAYCMDPYICKNVPGHSEIRNAHRNYDKVTDDLWKDFSSSSTTSISLEDALKR